MAIKKREIMKRHGGGVSDGGGGEIKQRNMAKIEMAKKSAAAINP